MNIALFVAIVSSLSPDIAAQPLAGCPAAWEAGTTYDAGEMVSNGQTIFKCKTYPMSLYCSQDAYKPNPTSPVDYYTLAWETIGPCTGTKASPPDDSTKPGCPSKWVAGTEYIAGSLVSMNEKILRCKSTAAMPTLDKLCNQVGYKPFSLVYGGAWQHAWEFIGPCSDTIAPSTAVPTMTTAIHTTTAAPTTNSPSKAPLSLAVITGSSAVDTTDDRQLQGWNPNCNTLAFWHPVYTGDWSGGFCSLQITCNSPSYLQLCY